METADVLVIGAGITGCATAHALVTVGAGRVRILDKAHVAGGVEDHVGLPTLDL
ncbi:MAG: FAD-dependent oxidoreductase [Acidimicrobiales bacterium]